MSFEYTTPVITKWRLDEFLNTIDEFENLLADKVQDKDFESNSYEMALLHISGKSIVTTREVLTLCAHGYPDGALSLARNLYEQMITIAFFESRKNQQDFQDYVDDYYLNYEYQRNKSLRSINNYVPDDNYEELVNEHEGIKKRAKHNVKGDYWWTGYSNFQNLVDQVMKQQSDADLCLFLGIQYARYKRACVSLHANCMGNSIRLGSTSGFNVVDTSPTVYGHSTVLMFAIASLIHILGCVCNFYQIDSTKILKALNELAAYYQSREQNDKKIED